MKLIPTKYVLTICCLLAVVAFTFATESKAEGLFQDLIEKFKNLPSKFEAKNITLSMYKKFLEKFNKSTEKISEFRFKLFKERAKLILAAKLAYLSGKLDYDLEFNEFVDWTDEEISTQLLDSSGNLVASLNKLELKLDNYKPNDNNLTKNITTIQLLAASNKNNLTNSVDLREFECVLSARQQGRCGSCYAFTLTSVLETMQCLQSRKKRGVMAANIAPPRLSPQYYVDCLDENKDGCQGSSLMPIVEFLDKATHGVKESCYEYAAKNQRCKINSILQNKNLSAQCLVLFDDVNKKPLIPVAAKSESAIADFLDKHGSLFGIVKPTKQFIYHGSNGIFVDKKNFFDELINHKDEYHAITIIGYGEEKGKKYWLIKNSWGTGWGRDGFAKVLRGSNTLGIENIALGYMPDDIFNE